MSNATMLSVIVITVLAVMSLYRFKELVEPRILAVFWLAASTALGYFAYRGHCSQPLTCDVAGTSPFFLSGSSHYFVHHVPRFTVAALVGLAAAFLVVRGQPWPPKSNTWVALATAIVLALASWSLVAAGIGALWPA